jgi:hypothetical protein
MVDFWKVKDAVGHIKGARTLSVSWTDEEDWVEIVRGKGIIPNHRIVVYGYYRDDSEEVAERLARSGYKEVALYNRFLDERSLFLIPAPNTQFFHPRF